MSGMSRNHLGMQNHRQQQMQRPAVMSPWEGGFAPGSGGGLLPTPGNSNFMSQLASPEAQLAVASNLLTSLLRPVQQGNQGQVPSLLSLGNSGNMGGNFGYMQPQSQYHDIQRNQSFSMGPSAQMRNYGRNRSPIRSAPTRGVHQQSNVRGSNSRPRSSTDQDKHRDPKRDRPRRESSPKRDSKSNEKRGVIFEGLPKAAFHCHVCEKDMWDAKSFENHVRGMAHERELGEREKSYEARADLLRQEAKLAEEQHQLEWQRLVRLGKKPPPNRQEFCKMCDFSFFGDLLAHRKSNTHQGLKSFLHPRCTTCNKEFPVRIELDNHLLGPDHLKTQYKQQYKTTKPPSVSEKSSKSTGDAAKKGEITEDQDVEMKEADNEEATQGENGGEIIIEDDEEEEEELVYNPDVSVGEECLIPVTGMFCKACCRFFMNDDQTLKSHCRTIGHFNKVIDQKAKVEKEKRDAKKAKAAADIQVKKLKEEQENLVKGKRTLPEELQEEEDIGDPKRNKQDGNELFDPMEETPDPDHQEEAHDPELQEENVDPEHQEGNVDPERQEENENPELQEENPKEDGDEGEKDNDLEGTEKESELKETDENSKLSQLDESMDELEAAINDEQSSSKTSPERKTPKARRGKSRAT